MSGNGLLGFPAVNFQMRTPVAVFIAGLVLVDPTVANVDGKPVCDSVLSEGLAVRNERESETKWCVPHDRHFNQYFRKIPVFR